MDLKRLRYFMAIAELGSFRGAAARLHISQSALSRRVQELEEEIAQPLFDRSGTRLRLLPSGEVLLEHARAIFKAVDDAGRHLARFAEGRIGLLRLGMTATSGQIRFIAEALRRFADEHPQVRLTIDLLPNSNRLLDALDQGRLDAAVVYGEEESEVENSLVLRTYGTYLALPSSHPFALRKVVGLSDLAGQEIITFSRALDPVGYDLNIAAMVGSGVQPQIIMELPSEEVRLALVAAGMGISLVNGSALERTMPEGIKLLPICDHDLRRTLSIRWRPASRLPALDAFISILITVSGVQPHRKPPRV
jgi:DNA-binding transcriptional LysR family regulator